jgi:hypothetical protein
MSVLQPIKQSLRSFLAEDQTPIVLLVFLIQVLFSLYRFFPTVRDINLWDESVYINTGRLFAAGTLTSFERNPLIGLLYALTYLPFRNSPYWLMQSAALGRAILFGLMWWSAFLIARRFGKHFQPLIFVGLLFCTTVLTDTLDNPSDALFAAASGFAFWKLMTFHETRQVKDIAWASFFLGLAALSRNDGLVLFVIFLLISLMFLRASEHKWKHLLATALPFLLLVGGYLALYRLVTGTLVLGTAERSYVAFQQGQIQVYQEDPSCKQGLVHCAVMEAQRLYGTSQENNNSILKAILRNPGAFLQRVLHTIRILPEMIYSAYGKRGAYLLFLLGLLGIYELARQKQYGLLGILLGWLAYLGVYFVTFFRIGYLQTPYFIPLTLAAIGVQALISSLADQRQRLIWTAVLLTLTLVGLLRSLNYLYFDTIILLGMIWIGYLASRQLPASSYVNVALIFLAGGLIVRGSYNPPQIQTWGRIPEERAVLVMQQRLPENSLVAAGAPGPAYAARMDFYGLADIDASTTTVEELHAKLLDLGVKAIYVDGTLTGQDEYAWSLIQPGIGREYERIFSGEDGSIQVLLVNP